MATLTPGTTPASPAPAPRDRWWRATLLAAWWALVPPVVLALGAPVLTLGPPVGPLVIPAALALQGAVIPAIARTVWRPWLLASAVGWGLGFVLGVPFLSFVVMLGVFRTRRSSWMEWALTDGLVFVVGACVVIGGPVSWSQIFALVRVRSARGLASTRRWTAASRLWLVANAAGIWAALMLSGEATMILQALAFLRDIAMVDRRTLSEIFPMIVMGLGYSLVTTPAIVWLLWDHLAGPDPTRPAAA